MVNRIADALLTLALIALPAQALAQGFIEVGSEPKSDAWWLRVNQIQPQGTTLGRHSLDSLNAARPAASVGPYCAVQQVAQDMFRSKDRETAAAVRETFASGYGKFDLRWKPSGGPPLRGQVAAFQTCDDPKRTGFITVVEREDTGAILLLEEYPFDSGDSLVVNLYTVDGEIGQSVCFECDDHNVLRYDAARGKLYWSSGGD